MTMPSQMTGPTNLRVMQQAKEVAEGCRWTPSSSQIPGTLASARDPFQFLTPLHANKTVRSRIYKTFALHHDWAHFLLLVLLTSLIHKPDGESPNQRYQFRQPSLFVGWRIEPAVHICDSLVLLQHHDHMRVEHTAL